MKTRSHSIFVLFFLLGMGFISCNSTKYVTFNAVNPAEITFAPDIESFIVVDRTMHARNEINVVEGVLTGELPGDDRKAVNAIMRSFQNEMERSGRFDVEISEQRLEGNDVLNRLPEPLSWDTIEEIASEKRSDMVIAIEFFDTDFIIATDARTITRTIANRQIPMVEFLTNGSGRADIGFRIYDPVTRRIVDEQIFRQDHRWQSAGPTPAEAVNGLINRRNAMLYISEMAGRNYAFKLIPTTVRVRRTFYKRDRRSPELWRGTRYADVNDWEESIRLWQEGLENTRRRKVSGKLAYNIAVAHEVLGDLDGAIDWASIAWADFRNRRADEYVRILRYRRTNEAVAQDQLQRN